MGKTLKKYLLFDLDTTALKEEFGPKRYTVAYSMIRQFLENCGFEHKQGSGYLSAEPISLNQIIAIYQAMTEEMRSVVPFGWQAAFCAARTRAYDPLTDL